MIRAVVSDFGGVLTTPLRGSLEGFAARAGLAVDELRTALAAVFAATARSRSSSSNAGA